jgi:hypothetical protein
LILKFFLSTLILFFAGCHKKTYIYEKPIIQIVNDTSIELDVYVKSCTEEQYTQMVEGLSSRVKAKNNSAISNSTILHLTKGCYDVKAVDRNGRVVGKQTQMDIPPEVYWVIK